MSTSPPREGFLADYLQFLLATASGIASHGFHVQAVGAGVPVAEWRVLACLSDKDGQTVTELARLAQMEQSRLTRVVERMDKRGLVLRERSVADRRNVFVHLTPEGRTMGAQLVQQAKRHEAEFIAATLTPAEGEQLKDLLTSIIKRTDPVHAVRRG